MMKKYSAEFWKNQEFTITPYTRENHSMKSQKLREVHPRKMAVPSQPDRGSACGWVQNMICVFLLAALFVGTAAAYTTPETIKAAANVYVSEVTFSPGTFFPGDEGTITVKVTNGNTDTGVVVSHATLYDNEHVFVVTSSPFSTSASIGPGQTQAFTFGITADVIAEGTFYPIFSISFRDADSLWYRTSVRVEDAPLELTITERPDTFTEGGKKTVKVLVWNPRESTVRAVTIVPQQAGSAPPRKKAMSGTWEPVNRRK